MKHNLKCLLKPKVDLLSTMWCYMLLYRLDINYANYLVHFQKALFSCEVLVLPSGRCCFSFWWSWVFKTTPGSTNGEGEGGWVLSLAHIWFAVWVSPPTNILTFTNLTWCYAKESCKHDHIPQCDRIYWWKHLHFISMNSSPHVADVQKYYKKYNPDCKEIGIVLK